MIVRVSDDVYIAAHKVVKVTADYDKNRIIILTDDGKEHLVMATLNLSTKLDNLVAQFNKGLI